MATDLGVVITVTAVAGGALAGLSNIGKAITTLKSSTDNLIARQKELNNIIGFLEGTRIDKSLQKQYDKLGESIRRLTNDYQALNRVQVAKQANAAEWAGIKGQFQGVFK
ncbi:phage tail protein [Neisseria montereyensis]|uniref:Phage tail protein n=1 Tax=Neisseria montereyensis TaxID=2973938 RepID=A0ABT2F999_9NEIS|nr:phage tail protein [Neisseria montereyensis]MCS4532774.1 phage tail protein [Neisseria montereyensis]